VVEIKYEGKKLRMFVVVNKGKKKIDEVIESISKIKIEKIYNNMINEDEEYNDEVVEV
jgi:hypothetical protein